MSKRRKTKRSPFRGIFGSRFGGEFFGPDFWRWFLNSGFGRRFFGPGFGRKFFGLSTGTTKLDKKSKSNSKSHKQKRCHK